MKYKIIAILTLAFLLLASGCAPSDLNTITRMLPFGPFNKVTEEEIVEVERMVVDLINEDRRANELKPVKWDQRAADAARMHVQEEADHSYISHWNMDGIKPQQRYSLAGGLDAVQENQSVTLWQNNSFKGISKEDLYNVVKEHQSSMLNEKPPENGHRKNILDPHHTGVGVAIAVGKYGVAMAQEFTNHYIEMNPVPLTTNPSSKVTLKGKISKGYELTGIYAIWEGLPKPLTKEELMNTHSYTDPSFEQLHFWARPNASGYYIQTKSGKVMASEVNVDQEGNFRIEVPLIDKAALDYISVEIAPKDNKKDRFYGSQFVIELKK